jgi:hypothetical protein
MERKVRKERDTVPKKVQAGACVCVCVTERKVSLFVSLNKILHIDTSYVVLAFKKKKREFLT